MVASALLIAAALSQTVDPPFLESTLLPPPSSVSREHGPMLLGGLASQTNALSRVGAHAVIGSDWVRFQLAVAKVGLRDDAGFTLSDGSAFTQAALGLGIVAPLSDPLELAPGFALLPALVFQASGDLTTEFDAVSSNRLGGEAGVALRIDLTRYAFVRVVSTVEYELTGLIADLGRDEAISGRHGAEIALSLPDRDELGRAQLFVGAAAETPYSGYEKATAIYFTVGVMYGESFAVSDDESDPLE